MKLGRKQNKTPFRSRGNVIRNHKQKSNNKNSHEKKLNGKNISSENRLKKLEELFVSGKQEFLNLFRECPEALVYTDIDGIILYVNHCFEILTGYREQELKGNSIIYCLKPEDKSCFDIDMQEYSETTVLKENEIRIKVSINKRNNLIGNRLAGMMFSFRDISQQMKDRKVTHVLFNISQIATSGISLQEMYPLLHEQLGIIIDATNFYIALVDSEEGQIDFPYYTDEAAGDNETFINRYCSSQSIFHYVLKIGKPVLMDFQRYRKMLSYGYLEPWDVMTNTHLWLAVPLKNKQKVIGVIALQSYNNARLYSEKDIDLLEFISQQLSTAIYKNVLQKSIEELKHNESKLLNEIKEDKSRIDEIKINDSLVQKNSKNIGDYKHTKDY